MSRASIEERPSPYIGTNHTVNDVAMEESKTMVPRFTFTPIHRMYSYTDGGSPTRTVLTLEVNLPSGIRPDMYEMSVVDDGMTVELEVEWPMYMLEPNIMNAKWVAPTGDGTLRVTDAKMTQSQHSSQNIIREYGSRRVSSTAKISLPFKFESRTGSVKVHSLGFLDPTNVPVKANGLGLQIELQKEEDLSHNLFGSENTSQFDVIEIPSVQNIGTFTSPRSAAVETPSSSVENAGSPEDQVVISNVTS